MPAVPDDKKATMGFTLAGMLHEHAQEHPESIAFNDSSRSCTFGDLDTRSSRIADALVAAGVEPGDRVALLMKNDVRFFEVLFACSKADAIAVGLNWRLKTRELDGILADANPKV